MSWNEECSVNRLREDNLPEIEHQSHLIGYGCPDRIVLLLVGTIKCITLGIKFDLWTRDYKLVR